jgi:hypothetical protein
MTFKAEPMKKGAPKVLIIAGNIEIFGLAGLNLRLPRLPCV